MPPRSRPTIASDPMRRDLLREFVMSERDLQYLRALPFEEARFRIGHELEQHVAWARRRHDFQMSEIRASPPVVTETPAGPSGSVIEFVQPHNEQSPDFFTGSKVT